MMKRLLLTVCMTTCVLAAFSQKFSYKDEQGCEYEFKVLTKGSGDVELVSANNKKGRQLEIPAIVEHKGKSYTVVRIASSSLSDVDDNIRILTFPNTIREIEGYLFGSAMKLMGGLGIMTGGKKERPLSLITLESLRIPKEVQEVGVGAFMTALSTSGSKGLKAHIDELPSFVTPMVAENYGLSASAVTTYWQQTDPNKLNVAENLNAAMQQAETSIKSMSPNQRQRMLKIIESDGPYTQMIMNSYIKMGLSKEDVVALLKGEKPLTAATNTSTTTVPVTSATVPAAQPVAKVPAAADAKLTSDVDVNLPKAGQLNENTFVVIIANENYQEEVDVEFAANDGQAFRNYCHQVLGVPEENIHMRVNATLNNMLTELDWISMVAASFEGDASLIIYYAGHGIPDEATGSAYLLPVDGIGRNLRTGYSLKELYAQLGKLPAKSIVVFMDACFSGSQRGNGMLASARGIAIKAKSQQPEGKMLVLTAAQGDETAYPFKEKNHGLFTYYILKKLQESKGECTMAELGDYVKTQVSRRSIIVNQKSQTPNVSPSASFGEAWKTLRLK